MKKFLLCLIVLVSVEQVFAPVTNIKALESLEKYLARTLPARTLNDHTPSPGVEKISLYIRDKNQNLRNATTISEVLGAFPIFEAMSRIMLGEPLYNEDFYLKSGCTAIAERIPETRNKGLVTLIRDTIGNSTYTLRAFHGLLNLANYYPSVSAASAAFSAVPQSFLQSNDLYSGEIDTEAFAKSLGLVFVTYFSKDDHVLPVDLVMSKLTRLTAANTLEELFHTIDATLENNLCSGDEYDQQMKKIARRKTVEENQKLTRFLHSTIQKSRKPFTINCAKCDLSGYTFFSAVHYLMMADYYSSVEEAEQAFAAATEPVFIHGIDAFAAKLGLGWLPNHYSDISVGRYISLEEANQQREKRFRSFIGGIESKLSTKPSHSTSQQENPELDTHLEKVDRQMHSLAKQVFALPYLPPQEVRDDIETEFDALSKQLEEASAMIQSANRLEEDSNVTKKQEATHGNVPTTISQEERDIINAEYQKSLKQIEEIVKSTTFNGVDFVGSKKTSTDSTS